MVEYLQFGLCPGVVGVVGGWNGGSTTCQGNQTALSYQINETLHALSLLIIFMW